MTPPPFMFPVLETRADAARTTQDTRVSFTRFHPGKQLFVDILGRRVLQPILKHLNSYSEIVFDLGKQCLDMNNRV